MRISDWSSDVCSSDLALSYRVGAAGHLAEGAVSKIIKDRLRAYLIKLADAGKLPHVKINEIVDATSAHSLRVGCDQDLFAAGVDLGAIMQGLRRSEEHTSELQSLMRISYAVFCLKKK